MVTSNSQAFDLQSPYSLQNYPYKIPMLGKMQFPIAYFTVHITTSGNVNQTSRNLD